MHGAGQTTELQVRRYVLAEYRKTMKQEPSDDGLAAIVNVLRQRSIDYQNFCLAMRIYCGTETERVTLADWLTMAAEFAPVNKASS